MIDHRLRLAVIIGSTRTGRFAPTIANWVAQQVRQRPDVCMDLIDLAEAQTSTAERLAAADAFVVVTPEYNHSFPAPLKSAIDEHSSEWYAKPVAFVSYGGVSGGLRAVEQLRQVFAELHAVTVRDSVSFHRAWECFDSEGRSKEPAGCERAARKMLDQLTWWAHALRDARTKQPYVA